MKKITINKVLIGVVALCMLLASNARAMLDAVSSQQLKANNNAIKYRGANYHPNRLIVKYKSRKNINNLKNFSKSKITTMSKVFNESKDKTSIQNKIKFYQNTLSRLVKRQKRATQNINTPNLDNIYLVNVDAKEDIVKVKNEIESDPSVEYVHFDHIVKLQQLMPNPPNDELFLKQWSHVATKAVQGWDIEAGDPNVIIAIVDTGVDYKHGDLAPNIWHDINGNPGSSLIGANRNDPSDEYGHGTHCAGIAAAKGNNNVGVVGVCPNCSIMPVKVSNSNSIYTSDVIKGVRYATDNGADVISMSFGGGVYDAVLKDTIDYALSKGVILVAAAGNDSTDKDVYPAQYKGVIAVSATDQNNQKADYSNFGNWVDVAAPGGGRGEDFSVGVLSTLPKNGNTCVVCSDNGFVDSNGFGYGMISGTSMATPYVAGLAGLILSHNPQLTMEQVKAIIEESSDDLGDPGKDAQFGYGKINVHKAVATNLVSIGFNSLVEQQFVKGSVSIMGDAIEDDMDSFQLAYAPKDHLNNETIITTSTSVIQNGLLGVWDTETIADGAYALILRMKDGSGKTLVRSINLFVNNKNNKPVITQTDLMAIVGVNTQFKIAIDSLNDPNSVWGQYRYSAINLPPGASLNPVTGVFSWTPTNEQKGTYYVTFEVSNIDFTVSKTVVISTLLQEKSQITNNRDKAFFISLGSWKDKVIWTQASFDRSNYSIILKDISTGQLRVIASGPEIKFKSAIGENYVAWAQENNVHVYNLITNQEITIGDEVHQTGLDSSISIADGKVVYQYFNLPPEKGKGIGIYDMLTNKERLIPIENYLNNQQISNSWLIYENIVGKTGFDISVVDLSNFSKFALTTNGKEGFKNISSYISGNSVVFSSNKDRGAGDFTYDVYVHNLIDNAELKLSNKEDVYNSRPLSNDNSLITNDKVIWDKITDRGDFLSQHLYDMSTMLTVNLPDVPSYYSKSFSANKIAYMMEHKVDQKLSLVDIFLTKLYFAPQVKSVSFKMLQGKKVVAIKGVNFGYEPENTTVLLGDGTRLSIVSFSNQEIICAMPNVQGKQYVKVITKGGASNSVMLDFLPDLMIFDCYTDWVYTTNAEASVEARTIRPIITFENHGQSAAGVFHISYFVDNKLLIKDTVDVGMMPVGRLQVFASTKLWFAVPGIHTIKVILDSDNEVTESDETNNTLIQTLEVFTKKPEVLDVDYNRNEEVFKSLGNMVR